MAAIPLKTDGVDLTGAEELMDMDVSNFRTQALGDLGHRPERTLG